MAYRIGIDAGSKTVKLVILDESGVLAYSSCDRHRSNIAATLKSLLHQRLWIHGDMSGSICITGSAGIGLAQALGLPFVQEVTATTRAMQAKYPQANAVIELGGEDAKVIYLDDPIEQRMNATCAGGTGGFIDTIAHMIGARTKTIGNLSMGAQHIYPIASRCAVFAQTDVRPLLNSGASKADIAASTLEAVVHQTISGLACGRPITGTVVFLGGPFEYVSDLSLRFRRALGLDSKTGIKPKNANLFTACGAALVGGQRASAGQGAETSLSALEAQLEGLQVEDDLDRLPPLFDSEREIGEFVERHAKHVMPRVLPHDARGPFYLGIDAGSTTVKLALIDAEGRLVASEYLSSKGDVLGATMKILQSCYNTMRQYGRGIESPHIAHATATGYGEDLLRAALGVDSGVVETIAHATAARAFDPQCSFLLDIGGQDMKAIWLRDGMVQDAVLNEACSSGCGAFLEGTAKSLRCSTAKFSHLALDAENPVDLGTKCTVFMTSRVRHAQKIGATQADLAAGIAYSVVRNVLYRVIGLQNLQSLGSHIVVQGGTFMSNAVLRAFEKLSGLEVVRPDTAHLMGAIGAAMIARERALAAGADGAAGDAEAAGAVPRSTLLSAEQLKQINPTRRTRVCPGCTNNCTVAILDLGDGRAYLTGNKCERTREALASVLPAEICRVSPGTGAADLGSFGSATAEAAAKAALGATAAPPNALGEKQRLIGAFRSTKAPGEGPLSTWAIGLPATLQTYVQTPFWHTLFSQLGARILVNEKPQARVSARSHGGAETIPSESVCYPAKLTHERVFALADAGANAVLMLRHERGRRCPVLCHYPSAAIDSIPLFAEGRLRAISPELEGLDPWKNVGFEHNYQAIYQAVCELSPVDAGAFSQAWDKACEAQRAFDDALSRANQRAIDWAHEAGHHGIVIIGRKYHADPYLLHKIDTVLNGLGFAIVDGEALDLPRLKMRESWAAAKHLVAAAQFACADDHLDLVMLESFGCQYEAQSLPYAQKLLHAAGKPYAVLKIDEMIDTAHLGIRLRTLAQTIEQRERQRALMPHAAAPSPEAQPAAQAATQVAAQPAAQAEASGQSAISLDAFANLGFADVERGRKNNRELCLVAAAIAGRAAAAFAENPQAATMRVPEPCKDCMLAALPDLVAQDCGSCPSVEWVDSWPVNWPANPGEGKPNAGNLPKVGILGAAPLCFSPKLNDNLLDLVRKLGWEPVLPSPALLQTDDVRYLEQLDIFADQGVSRVIYLLSFGCLKGHTHARGALRSLARRYPQMPITIVDYDSESSALNRENRIRLALELEPQP